MEYRNLGHSGLKVSVLCLGTMTFGEADEKSQMHRVGSDEGASHAILERALDAGVNFVDTADVYGQDGLSERVLGSWFERTGQRDRVVLATKFRFRMADGPLGTGASRRRIVAAAEASLRRLKTDRIDLYQVHMQDLDTPEEETLRALDDLVRQGKVLYVGCSNYAAWRLVDSLWTSRTAGLERFVSQQMLYNLVSRDVEREHVSIAREFGVGILPWSPLAYGFLSGKYRKGEPPPEDTRFTQWSARYAELDTDRNWEIVEAVRQVAAECGASPSQVALAWLLRKEGVASIVIGARKMSHLEDNLGAVGLKLTDAQLARLEDVSKPKLGYPYGFLAAVQKRW